MRCSRGERKPRIVTCAGLTITAGPTRRKFTRLIQILDQLKRICGIYSISLITRYRSLIQGRQPRGRQIKAPQLLLSELYRLSPGCTEPIGKFLRTKRSHRAETRLEFRIGFEKEIRTVSSADRATFAEAEVYAKTNKHEWRYHARKSRQISRQGKG